MYWLFVGFCFFFLIIGRPPRSPLFPSTPLFRSRIDHAGFHAGAGHVQGFAGNMQRSEEHTSELQSLRHLVCRLLLEKNKTIYVGATKRVYYKATMLLRGHAGLPGGRMGASGCPCRGGLVAYSVFFFFFLNDPPPPDIFPPPPRLPSPL